VTSQTLDSAQTADAETGENVFHYVRKEKIAESAVMGTMVQALCGEVFPVTRSPKPGSPVCAACKEIYESMPRGKG
jgi:formylmethanofuran dehydrogenase subunit E